MTPRLAFPDHLMEVITFVPSSRVDAWLQLLILSAPLFLQLEEFLEVWGSGCNTFFPMVLGGRPCSSCKNSGAVKGHFSVSEEIGTSYDLGLI